MALDNIIDEMELVITMAFELEAQKDDEVVLEGASKERKNDKNKKKKKKDKDRDFKEDENIEPIYPNVGELQTLNSNLTNRINSPGDASDNEFKAGLSLISVELLLY
ncbi:hypothetical protein SUGI_1149050 [Cryptomeria japonica]|nr:hypothetical protein SUGI_1149050 [Cryptomeria japonica]